MNKKRLLFQLRSWSSRLPCGRFVVSDCLIVLFHLHVGLGPPQKGLHVLLVKVQGRVAIVDGFFQLLQLKWKVDNCTLGNEATLANDPLKYLNQIVKTNSLLTNKLCR